MDLSFPLASEAPLGKYTISVEQDMAQKTFNVDEYGETWTTEVRVAGEESRVMQPRFSDLLS